MLRLNRLFRIQFTFVNFKLCESENSQPLNKKQSGRFGIFRKRKLLLTDRKNKRTYYKEGNFGY